jgi:tripeptidyl-peptidase-1
MGLKHKIILLVFIFAILPHTAFPANAKTFNAHPCVEAASCRIHDYILSSKPSPQEQHTVIIWLKQNTLAADCPMLLDAVSNPTSPKYGQHYSFTDLKKLVWNEQAISMVKSFLAAHNISPDQIYLAPNGEFIRVVTSIQTIEEMFDTELYHFESKSYGNSIKRALSYAVPEHLVEHIELVSGMTNFPMYHRQTAVEAMTKKRQAGYVTPKLIMKTYNLPSNETDATPKADQAVFESLGQSYLASDLTQFQQMFGLPQFPIKKVIGPNDPNACATNINNCAEASLDVQYIMALAWNAPTWYWSIPTTQGDIFLDFVMAIAQNPNPPQVYSISYGGPEHLQDPNVMTQFSTEVCKMGLRGFTVFASSGDDGVAGYEARGNPAACGFNPEYPALCPFVTSVGATMGPESGNPEIACTSVPGGSIITTGGGFSITFPRPAWQNDQVSAYLKNPNVNLPPTNLFASNGRAFPDISALGNSFVTVINGNQYLLSGTSASSPVFCAMVTLINGQREVVGKKPLGFLNPLLYSLQRAGIFNDISSGINNCAAGQQNPTCCTYGFTAGAGWDPLTGLGSIDFMRFAGALDNLP